MQLINDTLAALSLGAPQAVSNLAVYPLITPAMREADYLVLDEALQRKLARITEVSEGGSVPELAFENDADLGVLLLDGEELVGSRQNRVLNITILVGGHKKIVIPVSCVEQGRWRYNSAEFASADRALFLKARAKTCASRASQSRAARWCTPSGSYTLPHSRWMGQIRRPAAGADPAVAVAAPVVAIGFSEAAMSIQGLTEHARVRVQQRGIGEEAIEDLLAYGRCVHDHHGAEIVFFDKPAKRRLAKEQGDEAIRRLGKSLRAYLVIGPDGRVMTAGHRYRRIYQH